MQTTFKSSSLGVRAAFWTTMIGGMALCSKGIGQAVVEGWTHPVSISGYILGSFGLLLGGSVLFKRPIGPIRNERSALLALLGIALAKIFLATLY